jgi:hypothetical protein
LRCVARNLEDSGMMVDNSIIQSSAAAHRIPTTT